MQRSSFISTRNWYSEIFKHGWVVDLGGGSVQMAYAISECEAAKASVPTAGSEGTLGIITKVSILTPTKHLSTNVAFLACQDFLSCQLKKVSYRPPGTEHNLLTNVSLSLPQKSFGLIFGRSGSGKTTLLQLLAGFSKPTSGLICVQRYGNDSNPTKSREILSPDRVGIVFQFPERFFLADTVIEEITFGWPRKKADFGMREQLASKLQYAINSVGLNSIPLDDDPHSLSGGFKRRLALAIQLVKKPDLLLLDEPLAGLDWKARADVVKLLNNRYQRVNYTCC